MALTGGDKTWIIYQGPPRWDGEKWVNGDRFFLSGHKALQGREGVELAPGVDGLILPTTEYRYDSSANIPGARYQDNIDGRRIINASVNILGSNPAETRANAEKWMRNHPDDEPGKLWFISDGSEPRYLYARRSEDAGIATLDNDPSIRDLYEGIEWGWDSNSPYYRGFRATNVLKKDGATYSRKFFNPSTVKEVFPTLYLPGGSNVSWRVSRGFQRGTFTTPRIAANEEIRLNFDPGSATFLKRNLDTGEITNLWPTMTGDRPRLSFEPETANTFKVDLVTGSGDDFRTEPRIVFVPLFKSWI